MNDKTTQKLQEMNLNVYHIEILLHSHWNLSIGSVHTNNCRF